MLWCFHLINDLKEESKTCQMTIEKKLQMSLKNRNETDKSNSTIGILKGIFNTEDYLGYLSSYI